MPHMSLFMVNTVIAVFLNLRKIKCLFLFAEAICHVICYVYSMKSYATVEKNVASNLKLNKIIKFHLYSKMAFNKRIINNDMVFHPKIMSNADAPKVIIFQ